MFELKKCHFLTVACRLIVVRDMANSSSRTVHHQTLFCFKNADERAVPVKDGSRFIVASLIEMN